MRKGRLSEACAAIRQGPDHVRQFSHIAMFLALCAAVFLALAPFAKAQDLSGNARYSAIVIDAVSGEVLYANRADSIRYPASLTKIMTLYVAFDAIARGELRPDDLITMSSHAASQSPVKVYLRAGETIDVDTAMKLIALYSANDLSVALAEKIGVTEERFAALMTMKAHELGMTQTNFVNASGLPDARQTTSARDMAILARAVMRDFPQYYYYFNTKSLTFKGRTYYNHNPVLSIPGVDGMKTGYINASGYNLVASQMRNGHRLITVMIGGSSKNQRREHVTSLLDIGFDVIDRRENGEVILVAQNEFTRSLTTPKELPSQAVPYTILADNRPLSDSQLRNTLDGATVIGSDAAEVQRVSSTVSAPDVVKVLNHPGDTPPSPAAAIAAKAVVRQPETTPATPAKATPRPEAKQASATVATKPAAKPAAAKTAPAKKKDPNAVWAIQVGAFKDKGLADQWVKDLNKRFRSNLAVGSPNITRNSQGWYRTRYTDMTKAEAQDACRALAAKSLDCMVIKPEA